MVTFPLIEFSPELSNLEYYVEKTNILTFSYKL